MRNVADQILQRAETQADDLALVTPTIALTYGELAETAHRFIQNLRIQGVAAKARIGLCLTDRPEHVILYIALARLEAIIVPMDHRWSEEEKATIAAGFELNKVIVDTAADTLPLMDTLSLNEITCEPGSNEVLPPPSSADAPFMISLSSGTTGRPKGAHIQHKHMCARFDVQKAVLGFSQQDRYLSLTPLYFGAGRSFVLGILAAGGYVALYPSTTPPRDIPTIATANNITVMFTPPSMLRQLRDVHHGRDLALPTLTRLIVSGAAIFPAECAEVRSCINPNLIVLYATSEGGAICTLKRDELTQYAESVGRAVPGVTIEIVDDQNRPLPADTIGRLRYRGPAVSAMIESTGDRATLTDKMHDGWFYPDDLAEKNEDGFIFLRGRASDTINMGGVMIYPGDVEAALLTHPDISEAAVLGITSSVQGEQIAAFVVTDTKGEIRNLKHFLASHLAPYKIPQRFVRMDSLPKNGMGKVEKAKLRELLEDEERRTAQEPQHTSIDPLQNTQVTLHLKKIWEAVLERDDLDPNTTFFENGGTSQLAVDLLLHVEETFGTTLPMDALWKNACTLDHMTKMIVDDDYLKAYPRLVPIKATGARAPLFCVHTLGGNLFHYYALADELHTDQPLYGLQAKGVYGDAAPDMTIEAIAEDCIKTMRRQQPHGPYSLVGFSSGGLIAYEMAQQLKALGQDLRVLMMIDTTLPQSSLLTSLLKSLGHGDGGDLPQHTSEKLDLYLRSLFRIKKRKAYHNIGAIQRRAYWAYKPDTYHGPVDLVVASTAESLLTQQSLGWDRYVEDTLHLHPILGQHNEMVKFPAIAILAEILQRRHMLAERTTRRASVTATG